MKKPVMMIDVPRLSLDVHGMSATAVGAYFLIVGFCFHNDGEIPADDEVLANTAMLDAQGWAKVRDHVVRLFRLCDGRLLPLRDFVAKGETGYRGQYGAIVDRDGEHCRYCGVIETGLSIDHVIPQSRGGSHLLGNLALACRSCNSSKGSKLLQEWIR